MSYVNPKLRPVQPHLVEHNGRPAIVLHDPLQLNSEVMVVPQELGPLLALCDGTRDRKALRAALVVHAGINLSSEMLQQILDKLDQHLLLENERSASALAQAVERYRSAPCRVPSSAGTGYPDSPDELRAFLDEYVQAIEGEPPPAIDVGAVRGVVSPHIDYVRGGPVYAQTWRAVAEAARRADRVIIFGTDHMGSDGQVTLTRQDYATPWGICPTDQELVDAVAGAIGDESAFEEELHHIGEHSIELALVWLHYIRDGAPCKLVPILCGSFESFIAGLLQPAEFKVFDGVLSALQDAADSPNTLVVAAADLAHVGPAFGDMLPLDYVAQMRLQQADEKLIKQMESGDAQSFFEEIRRVEDKYKVCGLPPIYLALRLLEGSQGHRLGYMHCSADKSDTSWVSICGVTLS
jgi:AmmeMemoRadiSam system protein B